MKRPTPAGLSFALSLLAACAFARPGGAEEFRRAIDVFSDGRKNAGWVEIDRSGDRMTAQPYVTLSPETVREAAAGANRSGAAGIAAAHACAAGTPGTEERRDVRLRNSLSSLLQGPEGVSLENVLDLAHRAHDGWKKGLRDATGERDASRQARSPQGEGTPAPSLRTGMR